MLINGFAEITAFIVVKNCPASIVMREPDDGPICIVFILGIVVSGAFHFYHSATGIAFIVSLQAFKPGFMYDLSPMIIIEHITTVCLINDGAQPPFRIIQEAHFILTL